MTDTREPQDADETGDTAVVTVRYWASARAAAGLASEELAVEGPVSLAEVLRRVGARHPDARFAQVVAACSVLVGEQPASSADPADVVVPPGASVELLPPFAGG